MNQKDSITIVNPFRPTERFLLMSDDSLERIASDAPDPKTLIPIANPIVRITYIEEGNTLRPVDRLEKGQKAYRFPENFILYIGGWRKDP